MQYPSIHIRSLIILLLLAWSLSAHAQKKSAAPAKQGKPKATAGSSDTSLLVDPVSGVEYYNRNIVYTTATMPDDRPGQRPNTPPGLDEQTLQKYLLDNLKDELKQLPDGEYYFDITHVIIDNLGHIVHARNKGLLTIDPLPDGGHVPAGASVIMKKIALILNAVACKPAYVNGAFVPYMLQPLTYRQPFTVKDHKVVEK